MSERTGMWTETLLPAPQPSVLLGNTAHTEATHLHCRGDQYSLGLGQALLTMPHSQKTQAATRDHHSASLCGRFQCQAGFSETHWGPSLTYRKPQLVCDTCQPQRVYPRNPPAV